jgi:hypothetical protein
MKDIVITLPLELWQKIAKKEKRIELRKSLPRFFDNGQSKCYVVEKGTKNVLGYFTIRSFHICKYTGVIPDEFASLVGVPVSWISRYYKIGDSMKMWYIRRVFEFDPDPTLWDMLKIKTNPQSYVYTDGQILNKAKERGIYKKITV